MPDPTPAPPTTPYPNSAPVSSPRFSFKGYSVTTWGTKNAEWIKAFIAGEGAAYAAQQWKVMGALAIGFAMKFVTDALDYFVSVN